MNPSTALTATLEKHGYLTGKELSSIFALRDLPFADQDVCRRIRFPHSAGLDTLYFLKEKEEKILTRYVRENWTHIKRKVMAGEFSGGGFSPLFLKVLQEHVDHRITFLEADIGSMEDDIADAQNKIDDYENVSISLSYRRKDEL